jgi:periplasmic copper chaperone A
MTRSITRGAGGLEAVMKISRFGLLAVLLPSIASAHITIASGPALANKSGQKISFAINHGCTATSGAKLDTLSIKIDIPTGIDATSVRALPSDFGGTPIVTKSGTNVTSVEWDRPAAELQASDVAYYELTLRLKILDVPFTKIPWVITQVCRPQGGTAADDVTVIWTGPSTNAEPSPLLTVVPSHVTGWHKLTLTTAILAADMGVYFGDAQIVWKGTTAFSANAFTATLITMTSGVTALTADLSVGDEIWVKY